MFPQTLWVGVDYENGATPHFYGVTPSCSFMRTGHWRVVLRTLVTGAHLCLESPRGTEQIPSRRLCEDPRRVPSAPRHPAREHLEGSCIAAVRVYELKNRGVCGQF